MRARDERTTKAPNTTPRGCQGWAHSQSPKDNLTSSGLPYFVGNIGGNISCHGCYLAITPTQLSI